MPVYRLTKDAIIAVPKTSHADKDRADLQLLPRDLIAVMAPSVLVIGDDERDDSKPRIEVLGIEPEATLVVVKAECENGLKRTRPSRVKPRGWTTRREVGAK